MKKITLAFFASASILLGSEVSSAIDLAGLNEMQRFYYNQGAEDTKETAYNAGYKQAMDDFTKKILPLYSKRIKAYEAGKYLIKEGRITYPKVFRYKEDGAYKIHIEPSVVEKEFSEKDLYAIPEIDMSICKSVTSKSQQNDESGEIYQENTFNIAAKDDPALARDGAPEVRKDKVVVHLPYKNEGIEQAVNNYNINYSITKDGYDLYFANDKEKNDFCVKITGNSKCQL